MAPKALANMFHRLRALATLHEASQCPDRELLKRFIQQHDEAAFTALVERHGPMVLTVCRRVLHHHQDAEDACQATFLVLVRRAASIRKLSSLSCFLHGVALRVALKARAQRSRLPRTVDELPSTAEAKEAGFTWSDLSSALDEELQRLPEKYRAALVLCYLQGKTRDEAAEELGWKAGTLKGRLELGRKLLHQRLARRGVALSTALLVAGLGQTASACVPSPLVIAVVNSALEVAAGKTLAVGLVSHQVAVLAQSFLRSLVVKQLQVGGSVLLLVAFLAGAGWVGKQALVPKEGSNAVAELASSTPDEPAQPVIPFPEVPPLVQEEKVAPAVKETQKPTRIIAKKREREREDDDSEHRRPRGRRSEEDDHSSSLRPLPGKKKGEGRRDD